MRRDKREKRSGVLTTTGSRGGHAVKVPGGARPLSVLASSPIDISETSYQLSDAARETLLRVLGEDIGEHHFND